jgi:iron complex outermembrane receptor protein
VAKDAGGLTLEEFESEPMQARALNVKYHAGERLTHSKLGLALNGTTERGIDYNAYGFYSSRDFDALLPFTSGGAVSLERTYGGQGSSFTLQIGNLKWQLGYDWASQNDLRERFANNSGTREEQTLNQYEKFEGLGGYLIADWRLGNLLLNGGLRYDKNKLSLEDQFLNDGDDSSTIQLNALSPQLGFAYSATNHLSFYGGYALGYETPTLSELSANPTGQGGFNQSLNIQKANQWELGLRYHQEKIKGSIVWYHINTQDDILPYESASFPSQTLYQNIGTTKRSGLELNGQWKVASQTMLSASYSTIKARFTNSNLMDKYLPGIAKDFGSLQLQQNLNKNASIRFISIYRGSIYADNDNRITIPRTIIFNLEASKEFNQLKFTAGIENLLNAQYSDNVRINAFGGRFYEAAIARQGFVKMRYQL